MRISCSFGRSRRAGREKVQPGGGCSARHPARSHARARPALAPGATDAPAPEQAASRAPSPSSTSMPRQRPALRRPRHRSRQEASRLHRPSHRMILPASSRALAVGPRNVTCRARQPSGVESAHRDRELPTHRTTLSSRFSSRAGIGLVSDRRHPVLSRSFLPHPPGSPARSAPRAASPARRRCLHHGRARTLGRSRARDRSRLFGPGIPDCA